ncbi:glycosyltransferase family 2 protein [Spirosoma pulveris]
MNLFDSMQPLVSIITVNYDQPEVTGQLLKSLEQIDYPNTEVFVVDNGSPNRGVDSLTSEFPGVHFIKSKKNLGFAGGNNLAIGHCKGKYLLFLNNDTEVAPDFLQPLVDCLETQPKAGMASPKIKFFHEENLIQYAGSGKMNPYTGRSFFVGNRQVDQGQFDITQPTPFIHGAAMLISREVVQTSGLMNDEFFLYYEEFDWCARAQRDGFTTWYVAESVVWHKESVSTGKYSPLKLYYLTRNRLYFMRRNFPLAQKLMFLSFFTLVSIPKNSLSFLLTRRFDYLNAFWSGLLWNITRKSSLL